MNEKVETLNEIDPAAVELLESAGVTTIRDLADSQVNGLYKDLVRANGMFHVREESPYRNELAHWIQLAQNRIGEVSGPDSEVVSSEQVEENLPEDPEPMIARAVPPQVLMEQGIAVSDVPIAHSILEPQPEKALPKKIREIRVDHEVVRPDQRGLPEVTRLTSEASGEEKVEAQPLTRPEPQLATKVRDETNQGKDRHSRSYIRGVLHPQGMRVWFGAAITAAVIILFPLTLVALGIFLVEKNLWLFVAPALLVIFVFLYLVLAWRMKCRICGQPLFARKRCFRHVKAHRLFFMGYILPMSLHVLLFRWFRCSYCGTSIRIKE